MVTKTAAKKTAPKKTAAKKSKVKAAAPWDHDNPKGDGEHQPLSPQAKATAKRRARAAGRPYPNLVDNMRVAKEEKARDKEQ